MISFIAHRNSSQDLLSDLVYYYSEQSFCCEPWISNDFSIIIGDDYVGIDISTANNQVLQVSGLSPKSSWEKTQLNFPGYFIGTLYLESSEVLVPGTGLSYGTEWKTYFDDNGQICIGDTNFKESDICVEFAIGCFAVIDFDKQLKSLWLKPVFCK